MTWQAASLVLLAIALAFGFAWYERERPPARVVAVVAALAALAVVGRLAFAAFPNVKPTTDIVLFAGFALGAIPGFAVGAVTAIVSNIFLSQGPWTVWQMAGWGAVGVAGALLARFLRGREPSRWTLAAVCGLAGLAFGAWMDVYQWTLAARQDLDTYVAVAGTSLPYNLAHAAGNVVFCLLIGPAFLRALARYRRRLEVRWERPAAPVVLGVVAVALLLIPAAAGASTPAQKARAYLVKAQNKDGGFGASADGASTPLISGWAALGLGSAGWNPQDVKRPGGRSLARYVARHPGSLNDVGAMERTALVARVAGLSPRSFGGRNLIGSIQGRRRRDGSISGFVSYTAFGVLALRGAGVSAGSSTVRWLVNSQNSDGGFGLTRSAASDSDMTGAVLQALATVGRGRGPTARRAAGWLVANQNGDGGFGMFKGRPSNAQSTAYAVQGLVAAGAGPGGSALPRARIYLVRLQRRDGSIAYSSSSTQTPVWVTAQALMALQGKPLPIATAGRRQHRRAAASGKQDGGGAASSSSGGKGGSGGSKAGGGAASGEGTAPGEAAAEGAGQATNTGQPTPESEGTTATALAQTAAKQGATKPPEPVPVWAAVLAALGLIGLVYLLHRFVLPRRADVG